MITMIEQDPIIASFLVDSSFKHFVFRFILLQRRNRKHLLMLRCLATNDLIPLLGMLVQMYVQIYVEDAATTRIFCAGRVVFRFFGLFSGCVAIVMAAERWLALTRPFVYQKVGRAKKWQNNLIRIKKSSSIYLPIVFAFLSRHEIGSE